MLKVEIPTSGIRVTVCGSSEVAGLTVLRRIIWTTGTLRTFVKYPIEASRQLKANVDRAANRIGVSGMPRKTEHKKEVRMVRQR